MSLLILPEDMSTQQSPSPAAKSTRHGFHGNEYNPLQGPSADTIGVFVNTAWSSANAREEWYTSFADQATRYLRTPRLYDCLIFKPSHGLRRASLLIWSRHMSLSVIGERLKDLTD
ncbi:uncharacterized protein AKAW2_60325A [Aspergillus luchuensis]|uniref:Uncharacterized protein n=1 Tax=Aspergillus kawachii TaxID=1069201 RepID=A0A7R7WFY2_ASPKA|nr:uncharacterized protein AKAW2_60325A [Aspergillus luchuensis]BCS02061.1 hypothetical protein AKAW2_60325A [Aspergillus luchuensis]